MIRTFPLLAMILLGAETVRCDELDALVKTGSFREAASRAHAALGGAGLPASDRRRLLELAARCHYELREYRRAESALRELVSETGGADALPHCLRLARTLALQGAFDEALAHVERARSLSAASGGEAVAVPRTAGFVLMRAQRFADALPELERVLEARPGDALARFSRGVALAKVGRFEEALPDLRAGLERGESWRDARFELALALAKLGRHEEALAPLLEILERDPRDDQASFQAARRLLAMGGRPRVRAAASIMRWFQTLRERIGESSRDQQLAAAGKPVEATLERAARHERLADYEGVFRELDRLGRGARELPAVAAYLQGFWRRRGVKDGPVGALESALRQAARARDRERADGLARLCLARDPECVPALEYLAARTRSPDLMVPHVHYAARLAKVRGTAEAMEALEAARRVLRGEG